MYIYWDILEDEVDEQEGDETKKQARSDVKLLLETISNGSSGDAKVDKYFKTRKLNMDHNMITYETRWTPSSPETLAYGCYFQGEDQIFLGYENDRLWLPVTTMKNGNL